MFLTPYQRMIEDLTEARWETRSGLHGAIIANQLACRCGYVRIPEDHPWFGKHWKDPVTEYTPPIEDHGAQEALEGFGVIPIFLAALATEEQRDEMYRSMAMAVKVHGGLTYTGDLLENGQWWIGFDCGHTEDLPDPDLVRDVGSFLIASITRTVNARGTLWTHDMVKEEVERLADQIPLPEL